MSAKRIILWRHGLTDYNVARRIQGQVTVPLNEVGRAQAQAAAQLIMCYEPELIISSPLERAHDTAEALALLTEVNMMTDERLVERGFGKFEGLTVADLKLRFNEEYKIWRETGESEGAGVESRQSVGQRVRAAVQEWADKIDGTLVVVSHGSALTQGMVCLLGLDPHSWQGLRGLDNCHWSVLLSSSRSVPWRLAAHNLAVDSVELGLGSIVG